MFKGNFINGSFHKIEKADESFEVISPSDLKDKVGAVESSFSHVDQAVEAARKAFTSWSQLTLAERTQYLLRLSEVFIKRKDEIAEIISRETGKPLWETKTEAGALSGKIKVTLEDSLKLVQQLKIENALPNSDGVIRYRPKGVLSVIGPFNFPAHLPNGHIVPALATGNTIVFKPSDKTPFTGQLLAECIEEAQFPEGVFNLVQGQVEVGRRIVSHKGVDGVLFTGSYDVGLKIKEQTLTHYWKSLALEMGGKNASLILEDADLDKAVYESLMGGFLTTGQRCSCTSIIYVQEGVFDSFLDKLYNAAKKLKIGHWKDSVFMGSLIDDTAVERYLRFQQIALREGAECIMRGKKLELENYTGHYVTPSIYTLNTYNSDSVYLNQEIFGPNLALVKVKDKDEAFSFMNQSQFGLAAAIFTNNQAHYEAACSQLNVGILNWNRTTNGASSRLPFGGTKKSGNGHPSAHFAVYYCTTPQASIEDRNSMSDIKLPPGMQL